MQYKYYIFISYSRLDNSAAAYLQKNLEKFRFPVKPISVVKSSLGNLLQC